MEGNAALGPPRRSLPQTASAAEQTGMKVTEVHLILDTLTLL